MPIFLDTHAWVWWVTEDRRLSKKAKVSLEKAAREAGVWISAISVWEVAKKVQKKQLVLDRPLRQWLDQALDITGLFVEELTTTILVESCELLEPFHGDSADQIIVASVRHQKGQLITKDRKLRDYPHVVTIW